MLVLGSMSYVPNEPSMDWRVQITDGLWHEILMNQFRLIIKHQKKKKFVRAFCCYVTMR